MRGSILLALFGLLSLVGWAFARGRSYDAPPPPPDLGADTLDAFARSHRPIAEVDMVARFGRDLELLDPRMALPRWHTLPREDAVRIHRLMTRCEETGSEHDEARRASAFFAARCKGGEAARAEVGVPPFMSPSGESYARLAAVEDPALLHVGELGALADASLDPASRALRAMAPAAHARIVAGDRIVLTGETVALVDRDDLGPNRLRLFERAEWDGFAQDGGFTLTPRGNACAVPVTATLCFRMLRADERNAAALGAWLVASLVAVAAGIALVATFALRARKTAARDRAMIHSTLTHELRTPATTLRLDFESIRDAYDDLPERVQESALRIGEGIERLSRAIHLSARYLELFHPEGGQREVKTEVQEIESWKELLESLAAEWPAETELVLEGDDGPLRTDTTWLAVAVRNLVENAHRHGMPPVTVRVIRGPGLRIRVGDHGITEGFRLKDCSRPFVRGTGSKGLGLGLAIAARSARLLGAKLHHEPSPTTFEIALPEETS